MSTTDSVADESADEADDFVSFAVFASFVLPFLVSFALNLPQEAGRGHDPSVSYPDVNVGFPSVGLAAAVRAWEEA